MNNVDHDPKQSVKDEYGNVTAKNQEGEAVCTAYDVCRDCPLWGKCHVD